MSANWNPFSSNTKSYRTSSDARAQGQKTIMESNNPSDQMDVDVPSSLATVASLRRGEGESTGAPVTQPDGHHNSSRREKERFRLTSDQSVAAQDVQRMAQLERDVARKRNEVADLQGQLREAAAQRRRDAEKIATLDSELRAAREDTRGWKCRAEAATGQLQAFQSSHEKTKELLELRTSELNHAQTFLSKVDNVSHAQVLSMVDKLNELGFQLASRIVDNSAFPARWHPPPSETTHLVEQVLGKTMTDKLKSEHHAEDSFLIQVALQAAISHASFRLIQRWDYASCHEDNILLSRIHTKLLDIEPQAVSARWRALVRSCIRELNHDEKSIHVSKASADLLEVLKKILEVSGGTRSKKLLDRSLLENLAEIVEQCLEFQRVIGEDVASTLFELFYPFSGTPFDSNSMEDLDDGARGKKKGSAGGVGLLCTVDLGLRRWDKVKNSSGVEEVQGSVVLKAKTMLPVDK